MLRERVARSNVFSVGKASDRIALADVQVRRHSRGDREATARRAKARQLASSERSTFDEGVEDRTLARSRNAEANTRRWRAEVARGAFYAVR